MIFFLHLFSCVSASFHPMDNGLVTRGLLGNGNKEKAPGQDDQVFSSYTESKA